MQPLMVRPWRVVILVSSVLLLTAYLPHPSLGAPLPQSLSALMQVWLQGQSESSIESCPKSVATASCSQAEQGGIPSN